MLKQMESCWAQSELFHASIARIKADWLSDITLERVDPGYWEPKEQVLAELDQLIAHQGALLSQADRVALETQRQLIVDHKANGISLNNRSGAPQ